MEMLFALFGGLAMFLYGMDRMSRALQRAAGDAMKRLLARLTATPLLGVLTGLAVTAVLQSSSAATVMVIGFVSAGLLELPRAVAVIYGINIGTTMTAQRIAFDAQQLVYPVLFAGFVIDFAARKARWQAVGEAIFSFGLLFEGIGILGRTLQPLAGQEVFLGWMTRVKASPLLGILLGLGMTMVVQSSSATIALLQNVARQAGPDGIHSVLGLAGAVPVLLGDNIGTTVTALLACIGRAGTPPGLRWRTAASISPGACWRRRCCPGSSGWWSWSPPKARSWRSFPGRSPTPTPSSTSAAPCSGCPSCRGWCGWSVRWCRRINNDRKTHPGADMGIEVRLYSGVHLRTTSQAASPEAFRYAKASPR